MSRRLQFELDVLSGIKLIETGYAPRNVALLLGRRDTRIHYGSWRSEPLFMTDLELIGKIDFNTGEMELLKGASIQQVWADEPIMQKIKELLTHPKL
ncbi:MAG TPA: hypothetical protein VFT87_00090 [Candidatus Saccharimonadales bacterium]|nr:hypothetical protein [Candidatus Saccharimonadales bacterium]